MKSVSFFLTVLMSVLPFLLTGCGAGDGSTLTSFGEPLGPPILRVSPDEISITLEEGQIASVSITISNLGGFPLKIQSIAPQTSWIALQNPGFPDSILSADSATVLLDIGDPSLPIGTYQGVLHIVSNDHDEKNAESDISIELTIEEAFVFEPTFSNIQSRIFSFSCTECHNDNNPPEGLNLRSGVSYQSIVNIPSSQIPELLRVEPFNPDDSYLVRKLEGGPDITGDPMPLDQQPLSEDFIKVLRAWISQGALEN